MAYATVEDLATRWKPLSPGEAARAEILLEDASLFIEAEYKRVNRTIDDDEFSAGARRIVCCSIVKRVMASTVDGDYSQMSRTAGSFNEQYTFANPSGDMYMTAREYRILGIPQVASGICQVRPKLRDDDEG